MTFDDLLRQLLRESPTLTAFCRTHQVVFHHLNNDGRLRAVGQHDALDVFADATFYLLDMGSIAPSVQPSAPRETSTSESRQADSDEVPMLRYLMIAGGVLTLLTAMIAAVYFVANDYPYYNGDGRFQSLSGYVVAAIIGVTACVISGRKTPSHPWFAGEAFIVLLSWLIYTAASAHQTLVDGKWISVDNSEILKQLINWSGAIWFFGGVILLVAAVLNTVANKEWLWCGLILLCAAPTIYAVFNAHQFDYSQSMLLSDLVVVISEIAPLGILLYSLTGVRATSA